MLLRTRAVFAGHDSAAPFAAFGWMGDRNHCHRSFDPGFGIREIRDLGFLQVQRNSGSLPESFHAARLWRASRKNESRPRNPRPDPFFQLNLNESKYSVPGKFDLIFCRNVLIYFDLETRTKVVQQLLQHILPEGFLFIGHAESLHTMADALRRVVPTIYTPNHETQAKG